MLSGLMAVAVSFLVEADTRKLQKYAETFRPARASLRSTEVKRWLPSRENWSAFGTFDIVAGDYQGVAEGSLIPNSYHRTRPRRYKMPEAEAARFLKGWVVGRTYDGYWDPEYPFSVFFEVVDPEREAAKIRALRLTALCLIVAGILLGRRRRSTTA
jgi:hypothetical protein